VTDTAPRTKPATFRRRRALARETGATEPARRRGLSPFFWGLLYVLTTTISFAPTLTFRTAPVRPGAIATRDVVAPRDLIVLDPEATASRKAEAATEVLPVYDFDSAAPARFEQEIRNSFARARAAFARTKSRGEVTQEVRDAFNLPIGDEALVALVRLGFSPALEDQLVAIGLDLYQDGIVDNRELFQEQRRGILVRDTSTGREHRRRDAAVATEYGSEAKTEVTSRLAESPLKPAESGEVAAFLAASLRPNLTFNAAETAHRREEASRAVESVFTKISRGKVIVRKGDEITRRTSAWVAAVRASVSDPSSWVKVAGILLLQTLAATVFWLDARRAVRRRRERPPETIYATVVSAGILFALLIRGFFLLAQGFSSSFEGSATAAASYYALPFAAGPIVASLVAGMGPALLFAGVNAVGAGVLMGQSFPFALFALVGSLAGIFGTGKVRARSVLIGMGGFVAAANLVSVAAIQLLNAEPMRWRFALDALGGLVGGLLVSATVGLLLPVFEHFFHVTTDIRMLELSNQNLPLLRNLALEAPGTYQHSLMVGHLAEAAAEAVGADALLARVSGYYHDIGKTKMPAYYIENQSKGLNRHDRLEPSMSALIIAAHVKEGVEMAKKARLPEPILAAIREHHGTKLIRYFYQKALTKAEPGDVSPVQETEYRHPGPKPGTRITGILMICDAVEAASRTILEPTPPKIRAMIQTIVDDCLRDGQFDECDLTMRDLALIVDALEHTVTVIFHHRIDYPGFDFEPERTKRRAESPAPSAAAGAATRPRGPRPA
jgi:putative nucleotidyltransferase with HDIG domain